MHKKPGNRVVGNGEQMGLRSVFLSRNIGTLSLSIAVSTTNSSGSSCTAYCAWFPSSSSSKESKKDEKEGKEPEPLQWLNKRFNDLKNLDANDLAVKATQFINSEGTIQVSYGFLVGYGSGFVMKRITRGTQLTVLFSYNIILSYHLMSYQLMPFLSFTNNTAIQIKIK